MWSIVLSLIIITSASQGYPAQSHSPSFDEIRKANKRETDLLLKHSVKMRIEEEPWDQLSPEEYSKMTFQFLNSLRVNKSHRDFVQKSTVGQTENKKWFEARKDRVTASSFGRICTKTSDNTAEIIDRVINTNYNHTSEGSLHGIMNEIVAIRQYEAVTGKKVTPCGVFIDTQNGFLAASPDGLIDDDGVLEVKCPFAAKDMTPYQAAIIKNNFCLNSDMTLSKIHFYYYQIQGQLHITGRKYCDFVVWTPKGMHIHRIPRDDKFWREIVEPKITQFYKKELLPEIMKKKYETINCVKDGNGLNRVECVDATVLQNSTQTKKGALTVYNAVHNKFLNVKEVVKKMFQNFMGPEIGN